MTIYSQYNNALWHLKDSVIMRFFIFISLFLSGEQIIAQQPWNYSSLQDAYTDKTYLLEPSDEIKQRVPELSFNTTYFISGPYKKLGQTQVRFQNQDINVLLSEKKALQLLPYMVSCNYWDQRYTQVLQWTFLNTENASSLIEFDSNDTRYHHYIPIVWLGYDFQPSEQFPIVFNIKTNTQQKQRLTLAAVDRLAEWGAFANDATQQAYERNRQLQQHNQRVQHQALTNQLDSIDNMRQIITQRADSISRRMMLDSIAQAEEQTRQEIEQTKKKMVDEELFLFSIKPAHSDYMFGLEFNFFNCYTKTISKIEIAVSPYDNRMRLQTDKFGRRTRDIRCMGPIISGSPAQYTFDELFWDDAGKIKVLQVNSITLYFTDGSQRTFNGYKRIMNHSLSK